MGRGLEISKPQRVVQDPDNTTDWTNQRTYSWDGRELFVYEVKKRQYRKPPYGFRMEWVTDKSNKEIAQAACHYYLSLRNKFGIPEDFSSIRLTQDLRSNALL